METMNVFDGKRKVIFEKPGRFEAPNWMPEEKNFFSIWMVRCIRSLSEGRN